MRKQKNRLEKLETMNPPSKITGFNIIIVGSKEEVDHPERFNKVLEKEETSETGFTTKVYHYERKEPNKT